jgi:hypothetical protein
MWFILERKLAEINLVVVLEDIKKALWGTKINFKILTS